MTGIYTFPATRYILSACIIIGLLTSSCNDENVVTPITSQHRNETEKRDENDPLLIEIREMEARAASDSVMDRAVGLRLLKAYQEYYSKHASDTLGQHYLFEAGRVADALGKYTKAVEILRSFHDGSMDVKKKAEAVYMIAFIYDAHIHNPDKAIEYYNQVIQLYPESTWAAEAKKSLHLAGKSDEEIIKFLEEKNRKPS